MAHSTPPPELTEGPSAPPKPSRAKCPKCGRFSASSRLPSLGVFWLWELRFARCGRHGLVAGVGWK